MAVRTKAALVAEVTTRFADAPEGNISADDARAFFVDLLDSLGIGLREPPSSLTVAQQTALRTLIAALSEAQVDARVAARFTDALRAKLIAIEAGATADQTAAEILAALRTVDGPGSGLDADLLDGMTPVEVAALGGSGGFTLRFGSGAPASSLGDDGDWYLATASGGWYSKVGGSWTLRYTDQTGSGGGLTQAQVLALIADPAEQGNAAAWSISKGGTGATTGAAARTALGILTQAQVDARAAVRYTDTEKSKLAGVDTGATDDQTPAQILAALLTVDGAGSGLDADLLDGMTPAAVAALNTGLSQAQINALIVARYTDAEKTKLAGVDAGAEVNRTTAELNTIIRAITDLLAPLASPALTGTPTVPTAAAGTSNTQAASTAYVVAAIAAAMFTGGSDGVLASAALQPDGTTLRFTLSTGTTIDVPLANLITGLISAVNAGTGLTGGGSTGDVTLEADLTVLAALAGATFTGAVEVGSASGTPLEVDGTNAGNSTIMKIVTPASGTQKAFGAGRDGEFDWVQFAGEIVAGKPGFALGPGTARDTNLYREAANVLKTDDAFVAEGTVTGATPTADAHLTTKAYVDAAIAALTPTQAHLNYIAISADNAFGAAEFTDSGTGGNSMTPSLVVPTFAGVERFIAIAVPDAQDDITDITQGGVSTFGAWVRIAGTITIGGEAHKVWRTTDAQNDLASGITYVVVQ